MAKVEVTRAPVLTPIEKVVLTMSLDEANTLRTILRFIGGDLRCSRRRHATALADALDVSGLEYDTSDVESNRRAIYFK